MTMNKEQVILDNIMAKCKAEGLGLLYSQARKNGEIVGENSVSLVKHRMHAYSVGKSFVSMTVGIAESEGLLSLDDKAINFYPEYKTPDRSGKAYEFTIRDLLRMTTGLKDALFFSTDPLRYEDKDWEKYFWNAEFDEEKQGTYLYSNFCSYILSCIIERVSGKRMLEYARNRLFEPIGIGNPDWTYCAKGHTYGCNGIYVNIDEMGYFGELLINYGRAGDKQIVPEKFVREATVKQAETPNSTFGPRYKYGYGYGIWMTEIPDSFLCYGSCGQYILCLPKEKTVLSFLSFEPNDHLKILDYIIDEVKETI